MKYADIKIVEQTAKKMFDYDDSDLFKLVIKVDSQKDLFSVDKVPYSLLLKGKEAVYKKMQDYIEQYAPEIPKPFKILSITTVDKNGEQRPLEDVLPSLDGEEELAKDDFKVIGTVDFSASRILEYKQWLADDAQTEFKRDQRTNYFDKDRLKELTVKDDGDMAGALIDPKTGKAVGAIAGTPADIKIDAYVQDNQNQDTIVGIVEIGSGGGSDSEGKDGKEGEDGEEGEPLAAGEVQDLVDEFYKGMHPNLFGLGDWTRSDWWGTDEHLVLRALKKIRNREQMQQVWNAYREKHDENLSQEIMSEYFLSAKKHKGIDKIHVEQLNREFKRLGLYFRNEKMFRRIEKWGRW